MHKAVAYLFSVLVLVPFFGLVTPVRAADNTYYYSTTCSHCAKVHEFFAANNIVSKFNLTQKEISQNSANAKELYELMLSRGIPESQMGVPYLNFEGQGYAGDQPIINLFKTKLGMPVDDSEFTDDQTNAPARQPSPLTISAVLIAALADSVNPCAFSVIIFLLISLIAVGARKRMIKIGLIYITTVFIVYLLAGLGLLAVFQSLSIISRYILIISAALAIIAGLINIKDFFFYGQGITLAIPESKKHLIEKYIKQASVPAAIILGFIVALFELPCTGGFYLAILAMLSKDASFWGGFGYLVFYNLIFVLPLVIILFAVYRGVSPEQLEKWRVQKRTWMRLVMGLVLVGLGIALITLF